MELFFLSADVPLTKTYTLGANGEIEKSAYPMIRDFTSHQESIADIDGFYIALRTHAELGHCLLKGKLSRPLHGESRAGGTNAQDSTQWLCFDLDGAEGFASIDAFVVSVLPPAFHNVDYVLQYSASAGVTSGTGIRAHLFYMATAEFPAALAKDFVTGLNLDCPLLAGQLELTAVGTALRYALDRTVNQPDKLIYIAPPILGPGVTSSLSTERIALVRKDQRAVDFSLVAVKTPAQLAHGQALKVTELRAAANLPRKKVATSMHGGYEVLTNPDVARVTGERRARGFVYLNLNGWPGWAYYYPEENPTYLHNFKGEPVVRLEDVVPDYYRALPKQEAATPEGNIPFVFREHSTDRMFAGEWSPEEHTMIVPVASISQQNLRHFFGTRGAEVPEFIDEWRHEFDPTSLVRIDFAGKFCNKFEATEYLRADAGDTMPPTIERVIRSVVGDDQECYDHFLNWLAYIFQTREKTCTAWIFHGIQGTGKGVLFNLVLAPIFGEEYCFMRGIASLEDRFNGDLDRCLLLNIDEARSEDSTNMRRTVNKLKNMITEPTVGIRAMRTDEHQVRSYTNVIISSNDYDAWAVEPSDRRFNVAPRQETKIILTPADVAAIESELMHFAEFLAGYNADELRARTALNNAAKSKLREASQDTVEQFCQAVSDGNLEYFASELEAGGPAVSELVEWSAYQMLLRVWIENANKKSVIKLQELATAYSYLVGGDRSPTRKKFVRLLAHKNLTASANYCALTKKTVRGYAVEWKVDPELLAQWRALLDTKKQPRNEQDILASWKPSLSTSA